MSTTFDTELHTASLLYSSNPIFSLGTDMPKIAIVSINNQHKHVYIVDGTGRYYSVTTGDVVGDVLHSYDLMQQLKPRPMSTINIEIDTITNWQEYLKEQGIFVYDDDKFLNELEFKIQSQKFDAHKTFNPIYRTVLLDLFSHYMFEYDHEYYYFTYGETAEWARFNETITHFIPDIDNIIVKHSQKLLQLQKEWTEVVAGRATPDPSSLDTITTRYVGKPYALDGLAAELMFDLWPLVFNNHIYTDTLGGIRHILADKSAIKLLPASQTPHHVTPKVIQLGI